MSRVPDELVDEVAAAVQRTDYKAFFLAWQSLSELARGMGPAALTGLVERLAPVLPSLWGPFARFAVFAGACVEWGGSPVPLAELLPDRAARALRETAEFERTAAERFPDRPLPDRSVAERLRPEEIDALLRDGVARGLLPDTPARAYLDYQYVEAWLRVLITCLVRREFRDVVRHREEVRAAAGALRDGLQRAHWVHELTWVFDDEPLVVLDRASGRGFRLTMSGIGDNFQLHTLVTDRVTGGGLLGGARPERAWVAAATDAAPRVDIVRSPILRRFRMFDGQGAYVYPEGRPSDVPRLDGARVLVLHPPVGDYGWGSGRTFEDMRPTLTLDAVLTPQEAAGWWKRVAPAREDDIMAPSGQ